MNLAEFQNLWKLMTKYQFNFDPNITRNGLLCIICKRLMKDACQSVCGCRYCHECIVTYLGNGNSHCPGGKNECNEDCLVLEKDVFRIHRINDKISKVKVSCPNESCEENIELIQMQQHMSKCSKQLVECPYFSIGCNTRETRIDEILKHLNSDGLTHTELLIKYIEDLKHEVYGLKCCVEKNSLDILSLKNELEIKDKQNKDLVAQFSKQVKSIEIFKKEYKVKEAKFNKIVDQINDQNKEIVHLKEESLMKQNAIAALKENVRILRNDVEQVLSNKCEKRKRKVNKHKIHIVNANTDDMVTNENVQTTSLGLNNEMTIKLSYSDEDIQEPRITNWINLCFNANIDSVWKINDLSKKRETMRKTRIFGESFYSRNYKLCLCLYIDYDDKISLCCYLMKGDNDDKNPWPMKRVFTFNIVDQYSLIPFKSATCSYVTYDYKNAFDRPIKDINDYGIGIWPFIDYSSLVNKPSIIVDDSIVVSCVLSEDC